MRYRKLDDDGDMTFGSGQVDLYRNVPEAVRQAVVTRLALWTGQWFLDINEGTPWRTQALGKYTLPVRDAMIRSRILSTPGVKSLDEYASTFNSETREFNVQATITTIYGQVKLVESL